MGKQSKLVEFLTQKLRKKESKKIWLSTHTPVRPHHRVNNLKCGSSPFLLCVEATPAFNSMINVHAVVILATRTFREKKQQQSQVFFRLHFNVYADVDNRERTSIAREIKQRNS